MGLTKGNKSPSLGESTINARLTIDFKSSLQSTMLIGRRARSKKKWWSLSAADCNWGAVNTVHLIERDYKMMTLKNDDDGKNGLKLTFA